MLNNKSVSSGVFTTILIVGLVTLSSGFRYEANWKSLESRPLPAWYDEAKIGIFIHWGVFSVPSFRDEWFWNWWQDHKNADIVKFMKNNFKPNFTYAEFGPKFTAEYYDAKRWANLFKKSGAKYAVLTTKHHEGFTMWPSKYSFNWNAMALGPRRDLVGEFSNAVRDAGLHLGLYHSMWEWYNPMYLYDEKNNFKTQTFIKNKMRPEVEELVNTYKPDVLWSDGWGNADDKYFDSTNFLAWLYNDSPVKDMIVVNDRWGNNTSCKHGGFLSCNDRFLPDDVFVDRKWENAMTIDQSSWGFRREASLKDYMNIEQLLSLLVTTVAFGGNILINVGPTKEGIIDPIFEQRLTQLGQWLEVNGEAIYESHVYGICGRDRHEKDVYYTENGKNLYGISLQWPKNKKIEFTCIEFDKVKSVSMLGTTDQIRFEKGTEGTVVYFPRWTPLSKLQYVYTVKFALK